MASNIGLVLLCSESKNVAVVAIALLYTLVYNTNQNYSTIVNIVLQLNLFLYRQLPSCDIKSTLNQGIIIKNVNHIALKNVIFRDGYFSNSQSQLCLG